MLVWPRRCSKSFVDAPKKTWHVSQILCTYSITHVHRVYMSHGMSEWSAADQMPTNTVHKCPLTLDSASLTVPIAGAKRRHVLYYFQSDRHGCVEPLCISKSVLDSSCSLLVRRPSIWRMAHNYLASDLTLEELVHVPSDVRCFSSHSRQTWIRRLMGKPFAGSNVINKEIRYCPHHECRDFLRAYI
jgi:hypothetical protein